MNTKILILALSGALVMIAGCAKPAAEEAPTPEVVAPAPPVEEDTIVVEVPEPEVVEPEVIEAEVPNTAIIIPENEYRDIEQGGLPADSTAYTYMIKPNDWLTKIAYNEYGNPNEWRLIYGWNKERIGDDPNLIYPYNDLELFKPIQEVIETDKLFTEHIVVAGENLWKIAVKVYSDGKAWSVLFWDNEELLSSNAGLLEPGMRLRVRTELWSD